MVQPDTSHSISREQQWASSEVPLHSRLILVATGLGLVAVFGIALWLKPDPRGFGTHQQLGLPECNFRSLVGMNCPHCGMTTSFSYLVRGNFTGAWRANPCGLLLAAFLTAVIPWCLYVGLTGRWVFTKDPLTWAVRAVIVYVVTAAVLWTSRSIPW